jgi:hypothetical protein
MRRLREGLRDGTQLAIEKGAGEVATGFDISGVCRARRSVAPISSVIASRALRITSKRTGSMSAARVPTDVGAVNREASDVIDRPHGRKEFKVQSSKKVRCVGAALYSET